MPFPSLSLLRARALHVLGRFPLTIAAGALAASAATVATVDGLNEPRPEWWWVRLAFVAALGLPLTIALTLVGEANHWTVRRRWVTLGLGVLALALFGATWPGVRQEHHTWVYLQVSAVAHLAVAFLPFIGRHETIGFWQYNRRLFLGFLRAVVFSGVLFVGVIIALAALDKLFGLTIPDETYPRVWFVFAFVLNTWIFLAAVPEDLPSLDIDQEYPKALKIFAQYILTPLVFTYLLLLLAYLIKIVFGGEWPRGWIGWLVASVSVSGLLGFLLVHPLRDDPGEGWIRGYARWLFVGLIPAAVMLLVAFWKRIEPYGLTEPRAAGVVLGVWLLGMATYYTVRRGAGIRPIPISLAVVLLATLYGPLGLTRLSVGSQGRRLERTLARTDSASVRSREANGALRFLIERGAVSEIAARIGKEVPSVDWGKLASSAPARDSLAMRILQSIGVRYVASDEGHFQLSASDESSIPLGSWAWATPVGASMKTARAVGDDSVRQIEQVGERIARFVVGTADTVTFDLGRLLTFADSVPGDKAPAAAMFVNERTDSTRARLWVQYIQGERRADSVAVKWWNGWLFLPSRERAIRRDER